MLSFRVCAACFWSDVVFTAFRLNWPHSVRKPAAQTVLCKSSRRVSSLPLCKRVGPGSPLRCVRDDAQCVARRCFYLCPSGHLGPLFGSYGQPRCWARNPATGTGSPRPSAARAGVYSLAERCRHLKPCGRPPLGEAWAPQASSLCERVGRDIALRLSGHLQAIDLYRSSAQGRG